jgi:hypothetical protein
MTEELERSEHSPGSGDGSGGKPRIPIGVLIGGGALILSMLLTAALLLQRELADSSVLIRVSGTQGVVFSGNYGSLRGGTKTVDGVLEDRPREYAVPIKSGPFDYDSAHASFAKRGLSKGTLKVEILANGWVVKEQETSAGRGSVSVNYSPQRD